MAESVLIHRELTEDIIGAAIEVHRAMGPGLLESVYEECLCHELTLRRRVFLRQVELPVIYKDVRLDCAFRADIIVENAVVLELKCVESIAKIHEAQLLTYIRLARVRVGFILNFNVDILRDGILRRVV